MTEKQRPNISYYRCLRRLLLLYRKTKQQERYLKTYLPVLLQEIAPGHTGNVSFKRTLKYWQLGLNVICDNLYKLQGRQLNEVEYKRIILLSVFGPLFDDLFDEGLLEYEQIVDLGHSPDSLVKSVYLALLEMVPRREEFLQHLQQVCYWQQQSLKQLDAGISEEELYTITYNKSYYSVLLYCSVLETDPDNELIYPLAGLLQLTNDAFDVWKDLQQGVYTLPNLYKNFNGLKQRFLSEVAVINKHCANIDCAITFHALPAMGWMAIEQLQAVTSGVSDIRSLTRKQLVCDMDSLSQQLKWIRQVQRFTRYTREAHP